MPKTRLLALFLLASVPLIAPAAQGDSDLSRMSDTSGILGRSAAADDPSAAPSNLVPDPPPDALPVPLDGGLSLLALAGAGYAVRRFSQGSR